jgi:D-alanyl-lipoteichoic acid acyltransferase DltB (MBOAT superfamily)
MHLLLADMPVWITALWEFLRGPWLTTEWTAWRSFWLEKVLDDRLWVVYALPLLPILYALPQRRLRTGIILTGFVFIAVLFGVFYLAFWIALCIGLYWFSEKLAVEFERKDVWPIGPPLAAWIIIGGGFYASFFFSSIRSSHELTRWLFETAPWLFPFGWAAMFQEPAGQAELAEAISRGPGLAGVFWLPHNIGTAYLAVRMLQYLTDIKRGQIPRAERSLGRFLAFVSFAPTVMQGPIERYQRFQSQIDQCVGRRSARNWAVGSWRIALGALKALIATLYFVPVVSAYMKDPSAPYYTHPEQIESYAFLYFGVYINIFWLYLEFSAYCDIAIGISRILGYKPVENFNWPWIATSLRDFWGRWHISLSSILRDYIYIPLGGSRRRRTLNLCITFAAVGIWHGPLAWLAVWGALMGMMVAINQTWVAWRKRMDAVGGATYQAVRAALVRMRPIPSILAWALTMHCFCHSLLIFFGGPAIVRIYTELIRRWLS